MGDRCYLEVTMAEKDRERFERLVIKDKPSWGPNFWNESWVEDDVFTGTLEEVNYGFYEELGMLAAEGCKFYGFQGAGGSYGAAKFVSVNNVVCYVQVDEQDNIVVPINLKTYFVFVILFL